METNTQSNRQMLRRFCALSRVAGWAMIAMGVWAVGVFIYAYGGRHIVLFPGRGRMVYDFAEAVGYLITGLAVLGVAQFVRYVVEDDAEPRWLLRNSHIILCVIAALLLLRGIWGSWPQLCHSVGMAFGHLPEQTILLDWLVALAVFALLTLLLLLPPVTKALCVVGIAAMLRSVLPILGESKTLA